MTKQSSIQYISGLLDNPANISDADQSSIAGFRQSFPYFIPVRYVDALAAQRKEPYTPAMLSAVRPYMGNWLLFCRFLQRGNKPQLIANNKSGNNNSNNNNKGTFAPNRPQAALKPDIASAPAALPAIPQVPAPVDSRQPVASAQTAVPVTAPPIAQPKPPAAPATAAPVAVAAPQATKPVMQAPEAAKTPEVQEAIPAVITQVNMPFPVLPAAEPVAIVKPVEERIISPSASAEQNADKPGEAAVAAPPKAAESIPAAASGIAHTPVPQPVAVPVAKEMPVLQVKVDAAPEIAAAVPRVEHIVNMPTVAQQQAAPHNDIDKQAASPATEPSLIPKNEGTARQDTLDQLLSSEVDMANKILDKKSVEVQQTQPAVAAPAPSPLAAQPPVAAGAPAAAGTQSHWIVEEEEHQEIPAKTATPVADAVSALPVPGDDSPKPADAIPQMAATADNKLAETAAPKETQPAPAMAEAGEEANTPVATAARDKHDERPLINPVYTEDYFLQQGMKVSPDMPAGIEELKADAAAKEEEDKALMVMMSFSEWLMHFKSTSEKQKEETKDQKALKSMWQKEKLAAAMEEENEEIPENVFEMAVNSIAKEDGLASESLADIYIKQEKYDKAIEMYRKLSLRNPQKNAYFARKIEEVLKEKQS